MDKTTEKQNSFRGKLENLINSESMENGSNTPDFILAMFLDDCLAAFDFATRSRSEWYNSAKKETSAEISA